MLRFSIKRLLFSIFVLFGISIVIFSLARVIPGDPARMALGSSASPQAVAELRVKMHLNDPLPSQYVKWITDVFQGDFGQSLSSKRPVTADVYEFFPATLELILVAAVIDIVFAFIMGIAAAKRRNSWLDGTIRVFSYLGISVPAFVWAVLFMLFFGFIWQVLPVVGRLTTGLAIPARVTGLYIIDFLMAGNVSGALDALGHVFLPALSLAIGTMCQESRILRSSLIDNMSKEHITVTTSFGIPQNKIIRKYLLKPSSVAVITVIGLDFASMMGNAFLVEAVFGWPGLSKYCLNAMLSKDFNAICACVLIIGLMYTVINIIVDLVNATLDPRARLGD